MIRTINHLAILGGEPAFAKPLHVGRPNIGDRAKLMARISDMLDRRWFTNDGPYVKEFESRLADYTGVEHVVAMTNATIAQEIAVRAAGVVGEVIVPSFTFVATAHALQWQEITPVFGDIAPGGYNLGPAQIEKLITPRTTAIIGVHVYGVPCAIDELSAIARRHGLHLMFDAAHAPGCSYQGQMIGGFGEAEIFSFHATKFMNSFEGGAVLTNDGDLAERMRYMRNFGFSGYDQVNYVGTNGKMTEIAAAMGLNSLDNIETIITANKCNYDAYHHYLDDIPGISMLRYDEAERNNYQYIVLEIDEIIAGISRDDMVRVLHAENVLVRRYFYPGVHQMEPYRSYFPHAGLLLPRTESVVNRVMCLPTGISVTPDDIAKVCQLIRFIVENSAQLAAMLAAGTR